MCCKLWPEVVARLSVVIHQSNRGDEVKFCRLLFSDLHSSVHRLDLLVFTRSIKSKSAIDW